ncbi:MAG: hypothetical protein AAF944_04265 [Bacteroidota bacterium]
MADQHKKFQTKTSTPIPRNASIYRQEKARLTIKGMIVAILPDKIEAKIKYGRTYIKHSYTSNYKYNASNGKVTKATVYIKIQVTIQTAYGKGVNKLSLSAYGRGTTKADRKSSKTSTLRFHEGQHGADYLQYMRTHTPPLFKKPKRGLTETEWKKTYENNIEKFADKLDKYFEEVRKYSNKKTHCVGITIDQYHKDNHHHKLQCSPHSSSKRL